MKNMALILAGGRGKRFWPHSRFHKPKQLLKSPSGNTMLRDTFERLLPYFDTDDIYIATIEDLIQPIREMLPEIDMLNYIVEPTGRDTAASIALSALLISRHRHQDANLAIFPIDHYITEKEKFFNALNKGFQTVQQFKKPVIIGIRPSQNETRYGYICAGENVAKNGKEQIYQVETFKEKPEIEWIEENKKNHELFWNTGIYIFPGGLILELIKKWMPKLDRAINKIAQSIGTLEKGAVIKKQFQIIESTSFEYGVLENVNDLIVIDGQFKWEDIGSWHAIERFVQHDDDGNIIQGEYSGIDTKNCIIVNDQGLTVTIGLSDMVVINNGPIQLIYPKHREGDIKKIINQMSKDSQYKKYL
jgi:mannose-1-phosphate guanylyltransferase